MEKPTHQTHFTPDFVPGGAQDLQNQNSGFKAVCTLIRGSSSRGGRDPVALANGRPSPINGAAAANQPRMASSSCRATPHHSSTLHHSSTRRGKRLGNDKHTFRQFRYKIQHREGLILYYFRNQNSFYSCVWRMATCISLQKCLNFLNDSGVLSLLLQG